MRLVNELLRIGRYRQHVHGCDGLGFSGYTLRVRIKPFATKTSASPPHPAAGEQHFALVQQTHRRTGGEFEMKFIERPATVTKV